MAQDSEWQGTTIHSFKCGACGLHFNVYSWYPDRHTAKTVYCPECGQHEGHFVHWRKLVREQVFSFCPVDGAELMSL